jgi:hypothetical protein
MVSLRALAMVRESSTLPVEKPEMHKLKPSVKKNTQVPMAISRHYLPQKA